MSEPTYAFNEIQNMGAVEQLGAYRQMIIMVLRDMDEELQTQLRLWEAGSRQAYNDAKLKWDTNAQAMPGGLDSASTTLDEITRLYSHVNREVEGMF